MSPWSNDHRCLEYHYTPYIYIEGRYTPCQSSTEALHTSTPTARSSMYVYMHIYIYIYIYIYRSSQSIEDRCLEYHYTHCEI